ncbi:MAG: SDR family oxidoreductase [Clostridiales bacterium]|nr:SDR family oxidoreductase [Bacillota bacterium]NLL55067.1 SDR family oxidoreductase [Clostridiales bacterium]
MNRLDDKIAAITGGGGGIGRAAVDIFSEAGATVLILEMDEATGRGAKEAVLASGGQAEFYQVDISEHQQVRAVFHRIEAEYGGVDVLYNNASVFWGKKDAPLDVLDMDVFERILRINLFGLVYCSKYAVGQMKKRGGGAIIHTASSAGVIGIPKCDAYTAAKGGTVSLTRSMAVEFGPFGIRTNCIAPAAIATPMVVESNLSDPDFDEDHFLNQGTPLRRWGTPEEIARTALFLASEDASYINGAILVADGGITIS